jgi:hypothetical protein
MFRSTWSWVVPVVATVGVFGGVLLSTPPGPRAITDVVFASPRGPSEDAVAYALGAAASLALITLVIVAAACGGLDFALRSINTKSLAPDATGTEEEKPHRRRV